MRRWRRAPLVTGIAATLWAALAAAGVPAAPQVVQVTSELSTKNVRTEESNLADAVTDALRAVEKSDIALMPAASFRSDITVAKGSASVDDFARALEGRDDTVVIMKLTGAQVRRALEHGLSIYPQGNSAFLQVSGITVSVDGSREKGSRVVSAKVGKGLLDSEKTYAVAMPSPLAHGALAYSKVWSDSGIDHPTQKSLVDAIGDYLKNQKTLGGKGDERLVFKK